MKFHISVFFKDLSQKFMFHKNLARITPVLHKGQGSFMMLSCSSLLKIKNVSDKMSSEYQNTRFMISNFFLLNHALYAIM